MIKKRKRIVIIIVLMLIGFTGIWIYRQNQDKIILVSAYPIELTTYEEVIQARGYGDFENALSVKAEVEGQIQQILFADGEHLKADDLAIEIEDDEARRTLKKLKDTLEIDQGQLSDYKLQYKASLEDYTNQQAVIESQIQELNTKLQQEEIKIANYQTLYDQGVVSEEELTELNNEVEQIKDNINTYERQMESVTEPVYATEQLQALISADQNRINDQEAILEKYTINVPYDALVLNTYVEEGEWIQVGTSLFDIAPDDSTYVKVDFDESYLSILTIGKKVDLLPKAYDNLSLEGEIVGTSPVIDKDASTIEVTIKVLEQEEKILKNMSVQVQVTKESLSNVVVIPGDYIVSQDDGYEVYKIDSTGLVYGDKIEVETMNVKNVHVTSGLEQGELIVDPRIVDIGDHVSLDDGEGGL